ncbi:MAG TPA: gluconate 2-dehydrogenase subunit 3 family protein [Flavisolibacter sp.]|nr:gluconate 2-dehydrogenase subunit 3 family protein [Flavisolibacter sp.]
MERREAVKYISILLGATLVGADSFLTGCKSSTGKPGEWSQDDVAYLDEIAETILPQTSTPGAKAAKVGQFMTVMVNDCYEEGDQKTFRDGMDKLNEASKKKYSNGFMNITPEQRKELLISLDKEAKDYQGKVNDFNGKEDKKEREELAKGNMKYQKQKMSPHYFSLMKQLTLLGYFTSEPGATKALRYNPVPGKFEGCIPYKKGDKAWA